jgi:glycosyltransferase involved in cell wall biosynthesis
LAARLSVADAVTFLGPVPEADMPRWFAGLDFYVHATDGEGFSNALLNAAASGLPLVASDVAGVSDVFSDRVNASLVPPRDPTALTARLAALVADPEAATELGRAARQLVTDHYSADRMADDYLRLLSEIDPAGPWTYARGDTAKKS